MSGRRGVAERGIGGHQDAEGFAFELHREMYRIVEEVLRAHGLANALSPAQLPPHTLRDRGTYDSGARYRAGDIVEDGGATFVALVGNTGVATSDAGTWRLITGGVPPPFVYLVDTDGYYLVDYDGRYLYEGIVAPDSTPVATFGTTTYA